MLGKSENVEEMEARVNQEVEQVNATIQAYNAAIQKTLELLEAFSSKIKK